VEALKKFREDAAAIAKWFKPVARAQVADAYWDPKDKCVKNTSNQMLAQVLTEMDDLYWIADVPPPSPKRKWAQAEEEMLVDSISTMKMAVSTKKNHLKLVLKSGPSDQTKKIAFEDQETVSKDAATVTSQNSTY